jgi:predicted nuclease of restriction endonuclease-like (RecB) superfamily
MNEIDRVTGSPADEDALFGDVATLIESARTRAAAAVNSELVMLYWHVGRRVREEILGDDRAAYGQQVAMRLAARLTDRYGRGYGWRNLFRMVKFAELYPESNILSPLATKLTWTNITEVLTVGDPIKRDFYLALCARERWTKRTLRAQISGKLYERTIAARGSDEGIEAEIASLREEGTSTPGLAFRDPYVLDFLGLPAKHSETELEQAILDDMQRFLSELGAGFAFVERQKRIIVDDKDYHLYLRWLQAYDRVPGEEPPIGLILCSGKGPQQTALLGLDDGEIRAARYITEPLRAQMQRRLASSAKELPAAEGEQAPRGV